MLVLFGAGCTATHVATPYNPMGLSGKVAPQAEKHFALARILWGQDGAIASNPLLAIKHLDEAIEAQPDYAEAYLWRAKAWSELGEHEKAFDDITASIRILPTPKAYATRGLVSIRMGNFLGATRDLDYAIAHDAKLAEAFETRAIVHLQSGDVEQGCSDLLQACELGLCEGIEAAQSDGLCLKKS